MNKLTALVIVIFSILLSCQNNKSDRKLINQLATFFKMNYIDSTENIDSFRLIKIDTITEKEILEEQFFDLTNKLNTLVELYKLNGDLLSVKASQIKMYGLIDSKALVDIERNEYGKEKEKSNLLKIEIDSVIKLGKKQESILKKADSLIAIAYQAKCFYQVRKKDMSVQRDTAYIFLNSNNDIIKRDQLIKPIYTINFDKF